MHKRIQVRGLHHVVSFLLTFLWYLDLDVFVGNLVPYDYVAFLEWIM